MSPENANHPELQPGEIFLCNASENSYSLIGWKTKRRGIRSINPTLGRGQKLADLAPVFVQRSELDPDTLARLEA
jgi:hypothetical protein